MVPHFELQAIMLVCPRDRDGGSAWRELDRVAEQICQGLRNSIVIGPDRPSYRTMPQSDSRPFGDRANQLQSVVEKLADFDAFPGQGYLPRFEAFDVQDVIDQPDEPICVRH